jgi:hypothetical protein
MLNMSLDQTKFRQNSYRCNLLVIRVQIIRQVSLNESKNIQYIDSGSKRNKRFGLFRDRFCEFILYKMLQPLCTEIFVNYSLTAFGYVTLFSLKLWVISFS